MFNLLLNLKDAGSNSKLTFTSIDLILVECKEEAHTDQENDKICS